jgi:hypothetical protein
MDYTYQFEAHLREHRPSRLGQRLWWMPAAAGLGVVVADGIYLASAPFDQLSAALAGPLLILAALLFLLAWAVLSVADWTYPTEKRYREAEHAAACEARAYILAGRLTRGEHAAEAVRASAFGELQRGGPPRPRQHPAPETASRHRAEKPGVEPNRAASGDSLIPAGLSR